MIKREEFVVKNRDGACTPTHGFVVFDAPFGNRINKAKRVTVVIETEEKSLGEIAREQQVALTNDHEMMDGIELRYDASGLRRVPVYSWSELDAASQAFWQDVADRLIDAAVERGLVKRV